MPTGRKLIAEIDSFSADAGRFAFWWLGQHGFALKFRSAVVYVDAYLSPSKARRVPPLLEPREVTNATLFLGTHDHSDHIDRRSWPELAKASPGAKFVAPSLLLPALADELGIDPARFVGLDDGESAEVAGLRVSAVAAAHERLSPDPATGRHPFLGYVIESDGFAVYHAGDTCRYEGLLGRLSRWRLDLALLPINGRDARRLRSNCIGNMTYQEAADLAGELEPWLTVPAHYEMFAANSEDVGLFIDYMAVKYPHLAALALEHGETVVRTSDARRA